VFGKRPSRPGNPLPDDPAQIDPRLEIAAATRAFEAGDLPHAATHVEHALVAAPTLPEAHEMLARLASHPDGGSRLFPRADSMAVDRCLARAHTLAFERKFDEALVLLAMAQAFHAQAPWADVPWVTNPDTAAAADPDVVARVALHLLDVQRTAPDLGSIRRAMQPYLRLVRNAAAAHPGHARLHGAAAYLVRRFDAAAAARYAERADYLEPSHAALVVLGMAYRDLDRVEDALAAFERALTFEPGSIGVYADIVDMLFDANRLDESLSYAERALGIAPDHACSKATVLAIEFSRTRQAQYLDGLGTLYHAQPQGSHEQGHIGQLMFEAMQKAGARTTVLQGTRRQVLRQAKRLLKQKKKTRSLRCVKVRLMHFMAPYGTARQKDRLHFSHFFPQ
jgi:tetratricopeptide (TPR) repeat protein